MKGLGLTLFGGSPWGDRWCTSFRNGIPSFTYDMVGRRHDWKSGYEGYVPEPPGRVPAARERLNWRWVGEVSRLRFR